MVGKVDLTPMAIAAGRRLADRLFNNMPEAKADYDNVPSVVFAHPTIGTCGLTEPQAVAQYGAENVKVYESDFVNLYYGTFFEGNAGDKPVTKYKLVCVGADQRVVGLHMIGELMFFGNEAKYNNNTIPLICIIRNGIRRGITRIWSSDEDGCHKV